MNAESTIGPIGPTLPEVCNNRTKSYCENLLQAEPDNMKKVMLVYKDVQGNPQLNSWFSEESTARTKLNRAVDSSFKISCRYIRFLLSCKK